ncbi:hypothetical protein HA402_012676 [Bradysia odoriphaga]|nr:hypothetical protein HA402_012676 [Bradysia odoriphaga]
MTCLRDLSNEVDLKLEQIKLKIFPLLKGNPLLIEWFKQCFPNDTTGDCPGEEFESLSFYRAENAHQTDDENDVYENVNQSEIVPDPVENPCHIRYLNGRVYYGSRILLPAKLSFLVVTASDQNAINEVAKSEPNHSKSKDASADGNETDYRCVHSIKQYGDNKMKECHKNQLETPENSICEEVDNDKSTDEQNCSDVTDDAEPQTSESCVQSDEKILSTSAESLDIPPNTCDDLTLKAHGIRLNPTVHQSNVIKSEDLLCLLDPIDDVAEKVSEESLKNSPKKQATRAHRKSPNAKKTTKRSPVNSKKPQPGANVSAEDSNAIRTAKRLKRLIETDDGDEPERLVKKTKLPKCTKPAADTSKNRKSKLSSSDEVPANGKTEPSTSTAETSPSPTASTASTTWSRDEDKLVLEQIKMGFTNEENLVLTLHTKLPKRSYSEIFERFTFLMDIIANL